MRLAYTCSSCKEQNHLKEKAATRPELQMKLGKDEVQVNCDSCGKLDKKHINQITAVIDNRMILLGLGLGVIVTLALWNTFGAISTLSLGIPFLFWVSESKGLSSFNKYMIRRK